MTTTNGHKAADPVDVLRRADGRWATKRGDDPAPREYLEHLAKFVEPLVQPPKVAVASSTSDAERAQLQQQVAAAEQLSASRGAAVDQLTAELAAAHADRDRASDDFAAAMRRINPLDARVDGLTDELAASRDDALTARNERDAAAAESNSLTKQVGQLRADYDSAIADTSKLAELYEQIVRERDQLAAQVAVVQAHVCTWESPGPNQRLLPCECGRPFPRYAVEELTDPVKPDADDWALIFARIRSELKGAR